MVLKVWGWARISGVTDPTLQPPWPWILRKLVNLGKYYWVATPPFLLPSQVPFAPLLDGLLTKGLVTAGLVTAVDLVGLAFIGPVLLHFFVINVEEGFTESSTPLL